MSLKKYMNLNKEKVNKRNRRRARIRAVIGGTADCPRLSVWRSHAHLYAQLIDDGRGITLVSVHSREAAASEQKGKVKGKELSRKVGIGYEVGEKLAAKAKAKKITRAVFDRGGYKYHGRVKAIADGARAGGLEF